MSTRRLSLLTLACTALAGHGIAQAQEEQGRVISSTPVIQQVAVPRQVCSDEVVTYEGRSSGAGALLGAVAGGAAGNAIGNGGGRAPQLRPAWRFWGQPRPRPRFASCAWALPRMCARST